MGDKHESCAGCMCFEGAEEGIGIGLCQLRPELDSEDKIRAAGSWCTWYTAAEPPKPTTLRVRIAVAVTADGRWNAEGYSPDVIGRKVINDEDIASNALDNINDGAARITWVEADVYLPAAAETVEGVTSEHGEDEDE